MTSGEFLIYLRKQNSLSRTDLAKISGFNAKTIEAYESDNPKIQRTISEDYINFISAYFGYDPQIFIGINLALMDDKDIYLYKLGKFSQSLRQYMMWTNTSLIDFAASLKMNSEQFKELDLKLLDMATKLNNYFLPCSEYDIDIAIEILVKFYHLNKINENMLPYWFKDLSYALIVIINKFKPSSMGIQTIDFPQTEHYQFDSFYKLEKNGLEFNQSNLKRSISEGVILDEEEKELIDLWRMASYPLQQSILDSLRQVRERDLKITKEIMKISGLIPKEE